MSDPSYGYHPETVIDYVDNPVVTLPDAVSLGARELNHAWRARVLPEVVEPANYALLIRPRKSL
jgi:hypothetical protein